ncbi:MAG: OmpA family protein [Acidobacteria bacterium]|nr:OmpA family protein [Acidobacteriota bacterium]
MQLVKSSQSLSTLLAAAALAVSVSAQQPVTQSAQSQSVSAVTVPVGQKQKLSGVILEREADSLLVRDYKGTTYQVSVSGSTKIKERKSNPFRGAKSYEAADLSRGLAVEIEGRGNDAGALVAEEIKFTQTELRVANSVVSVVTPVEGRVRSAETRLTQSEENAKRLSGQIDELAAVANTANGGARAAQETADKAMAAANSANERITATGESLNNRISSLDEYDAAKTINITFKVGSAKLSEEAKAALDEIAAQAKNEKGYVIQVAGFASADGNETLNRRLSQQRAEAVMSYLIENHEISQRRVVTPLGFGEARPAADNTTREGRAQNRRVEVAILVSKGLTTTNGTVSSVNPQQ